MMNVIEMERILDFGKLYDAIHTILITHRYSIQPIRSEDTALAILNMVMHTDIVDECYKRDWQLLDEGEGDHK